MIKRFQPISVFSKEPYRKILAFPTVKESEIQKRMVEAKAMLVPILDMKDLSSSLKIRAEELSGKLKS